MANVAVSWFSVHIIFTLRFARLYYARPADGIDFGQDEPRTTWLSPTRALTLGITFQVPDSTLQSWDMRDTAPRYALLSHLFSAIILAAARQPARSPGRRRLTAARAARAPAAQPGFW